MRPSRMSTTPFAMGARLTGCTVAPVMATTAEASMGSVSLCDDGIVCTSVLSGVAMAPGRTAAVGAGPSTPAMRRTGSPRRASSSSRS
jgi:hypothetical protein